MIKETLISIARWIAVLPAAILTIVVVNSIYDWGTQQLGYGEFLTNLFNSNGFGGHYILGPIYLLWRYALSTSMGLIAAMLIAPKHNMIVGFILLGCFILAVIVFAVILVSQNPNVPASYYARIVVETLGQLIGFGIAIHVVNKERKEAETWKYFRDLQSGEK